MTAQEKVERLANGVFEHSTNQTVMEMTAVMRSGITAANKG